LRDTTICVEKEDGIEKIQTIYTDEFLPGNRRRARYYPQLEK